MNDCGRGAMADEVVRKRVGGVGAGNDEQKKSLDQ